MNDEDMSTAMNDDEAAAIIDTVRDLLLTYADERPDLAADMLLKAAERWHRYRVTLVLGITSARHTRIELELARLSTGAPAMAGFVVEHTDGCAHSNEDAAEDPMFAALQLMTANANGDKDMADALTRNLIVREEEYWLSACMALIELTAEGMTAPYKVPVLPRPPTFGVN